MKRVMQFILILVVLFLLYDIFLNESREDRLMKEGDALVEKIENFRQTHNRLPDSLEEIGLKEGEGVDALYYNIYSKNNYMVSFGMILGESKTYYSDTKQWEDGGRSMKEETTYNESELLNSIEIDSFKYFDVNRRYVDACILWTNKSDSLGNREIFPPVIISKKNDTLSVKYLDKWIPADSLYHYKDLKAREITKKRVEYIYSLMNEYPIKSIHWIPESNTLTLDTYTMSYFHVIDTSYVKNKHLRRELKRVTTHNDWWFL